MLTEFCSIDDVESTMFINYFQEHYVKNCEYWAYCYRMHAGINTNMHLERMHRSIKYIYLKGKNVKRLDKGIAAIMRFVRDKLIDRVIANNKGQICTKIANIRSRHRTMEKMDPSKLLPSDEGWEVYSENFQEIYSIQKQEANCENCRLVCSDCNICLHQFQCSCLDSAIKYNMCKHIHLVARSIIDQQIPENKDDTEQNMNSMVTKESNGTKNCEVAISELSKTTSVCQSFSTKNQKLQTALQGMLDSISNTEELELMEKIFAQVGPSLAAIRDKSLPSFKLKQDFVPNKNIVPQRKFFSTKKKRSKKPRNSNDLNVNAFTLLNMNNK